MHSATIVADISPGKRKAIRHDVARTHQPDNGPQVVLAAIEPEKANREKLLRELLDDSHERIRALEAQVQRLKSAFVKAKLGEEE